MSIQNFEDRLRQSIIRSFPDRDKLTDELYSIVEYHLGWRNEKLEPTKADGGKKIRPLICLLCCQMVGGDVEKAFPLATAIQLFHEHTLVHDDIEDGSTLRRGRPTVWSIWGIGIGVNVGSVILALSHRSLYMLIEEGMPAQTAIEIMREFEAMTLQVGQGQHWDLSFEDRYYVNLANYFLMIENKTAKLIATSASLGAKVGGASPKVVEALHDFGLSTGLAFQIQDDWIGTWGKPEETGKPFAIDILEKKKNLPIMQLFAAADDSDKDLLKAIYSQAALGTNDIEKIMILLEKYAIETKVRSAEANYYRRALDTLNSIENLDQIVKAELKGLLDRLLYRAK